MSDLIVWDIKTKAQVVIPPELDDITLSDAEFQRFLFMQPESIKGPVLRMFATQARIDRYWQAYETRKNERRRAR
jgi:hypothetical protein